MFEKLFLVLMTLSLPIFYLSIPLPIGMGVKVLEIVLILTLLFCLPAWFILQRFTLWDSLTPFILLFMTASIVSAINSFHVNASMKEIFRYSVSFAFVLTLLNLITNRQRLKCAIQSLFFTSLVISIWGIAGAVIVYYTGSANALARFNTSGYSRIGATFGDPNRFGAFLYTPFALILSDVAFNRNRSLKKYLMLFTFFSAILMTFSRGTIIGSMIILTIIMGYYVNRRYHATKLSKTLQKILLLVSILFSAVLTVAYFSPKGIFPKRLSSLYERELIIESPRTIIFKVGWQMFINHPLLGIGIGGFTEESTIYLYPHLQHGFSSVSPHNTYLSVLAGGGLLTFIPFILILMKIFFIAIQNIKQSHNVQTYAVCVGLFASYLSSVFHGTVLNMGTIRYLWFLFSLIVAVNILLRKESAISYNFSKDVVSIA